MYAPRNEVTEAACASRRIKILYEWNILISMPCNFHLKLVENLDHWTTIKRHQFAGSSKQGLQTCETHKLVKISGTTPTNLYPSFLRIKIRGVAFSGQLILRRL